MWNIVSMYIKQPGRHMNEPNINDRRIIYMGFYETENMHFKEDIIMNELKLIFNTKNVRKVAYAVGFGLTIGKFAGEIVETCINKLATDFLKHQAEKGDKLARKCCDGANIKYDETKKTDYDEPKMKMGFNC